MHHKTFSIDGRTLTIAYFDILGVGEIMKGVIEQDDYAMRQMRDDKYDLRTVVDVGAHMGFFGAMVKHYYPKAQVISIEPDVNLLPCLAENVKTDICCPVAIRYDGKSDYYVSKYTGGSLIYDSAITFNEGIPFDYEHRKVSAKPLEVVDDWIHGAPIDLLKLDCEGSEFDILSGMPNGMRTRIRRITGEFHHIGGWRFMEQILVHRFAHLKPRLRDSDPFKTIALFEAT